MVEAAAEEKNNEKEKPPVSIPQIVGSALAAVSSTVALSKLGVGGTLVGAALGSVIITVGNAVYSHYFDRTSRVVKEAAKQAQAKKRIDAAVVTTAVRVTAVRPASRNSDGFRVDSDGFRVNSGSAGNSDSAVNPGSAVKSGGAVNSGGAAPTQIPAQRRDGYAPAPAAGGVTGRSRYPLFRDESVEASDVEATGLIPRVGEAGDTEATGLIPRVPHAGGEMDAADTDAPTQAIGGGADEPTQSIEAGPDDPTQAIAMGVGSGDDADAPTQPIAAMRAESSDRGESGGRKPSRFGWLTEKRTLIRLALATAGVFAIFLVGITVFELVTGNSLSGTVNHVETKQRPTIFGGGDSEGGDQEQPSDSSTDEGTTTDRDGNGDRSTTDDDQPAEQPTPDGSNQQDDGTQQWPTPDDGSTGGGSPLPDDGSDGGTPAPDDGSSGGDDGGSDTGGNEDGGSENDGGQQNDPVPNQQQNQQNQLNQQPAE